VIIIEVIQLIDSGGYVYRYNKENGYKPTRDITKATKFDDGEAQQFINNKIKKTLRCKYEVLKYNIKETNNHNDKDKSILFDLIIDTPFNSLDFDWEEKLRQEEKFRYDIESYRSNLPVMLNECEGAICDIEHYAQLYKYNASEGYSLFKLLGEYRIKRDKIKTEMKILDMISKNDTTHEHLYKLKESNKNREYCPRVLKDLFKGKTMRVDMA